QQHATALHARRLENLRQLQWLRPITAVPRTEGLREPLADYRKRERHVGEAHDVVAPVGFLAPGDALGGERRAAEAAEHGVVGRDLDRRLVRRGVDVAVAGPDTGRRDL